ncbi:MAG: hypothetical protein QXJ53_01810 [Candidatus Bathyarchaeia archaeon]
MRTVEVLLVIVIIAGAFTISSFFAVLPVPRRVSPQNLRMLAATTLEILDVNYDLSRIVFLDPNDPAWGDLQVALSACLPPNIVYNLTVYAILTDGGTQLYSLKKSISNAESLGIGSDASSYLVASSNVTFKFIPEKIGESGVGGTLYILNCSDARGWWITGYTAHTLAQDLYNLLSPYFKTTIMVQNTTDLGKILNGTSIEGETVQNAVVINTFGEAVPIPTEYCQGHERQNEGYAPYYDPAVGMTINYTRYCYTLGQKTRQFNWTWVSIVGYPLYYVSNMEVFLNEENTYGIYGMQKVYQGGIIAFLQGLSGKPYQYNSTGIIENVGLVTLATQVLDSCNYYGIYPAISQTSTRALKLTVLTIDYGLSIGLCIFNNATKNNILYSPGAMYLHKEGVNITGSLMALGLTRTPDIRLTALGLLSYYKPRLYPLQYTAANATRLVVLQLGQTGGI